MSTFATIGKAGEAGEGDPSDAIDEAKMEQAFEGLLREAENVNEEDPRQMANLMRRFSDRTGISLGDRMEEALSRLEAGEDPDSIEQEMGDLLDADEGFTLEQMKKKALAGSRPPAKDDKLYEL
ncbi:MAG: zinc ribbon domain-containing protein [Desulfobulbaceae bacterium]|nr:zinc ribbon domain-containing protein [Desulfobulbaceae bacterium]